VEGDLDAIFLGDLGAEAQRALRRSTALMNVDVVKVAHHGSADQDPAFYAELGADAALIGVGADNGYGHPTDALLGMLDATGTRAFRTDQDGLLLVAAAPEGLRIWSER
jgi:competence protein ComEC